ncbi:hypothetical protein F4802DRAFT_600426 [Xylaria palmicola]|nr:hypothetical protein F4802DRAFT_600426 [Xylaria palmicola]
MDHQTDIMAPMVDVPLDILRALPSTLSASGGSNPRTESQHQGISVLPNELVLHIVEKMDTITRSRFMATKKEFYTLITAYENSIFNSRVATLTLPPLGNALSSFGDARRVLQKDTFEMLFELELRDNRINSLLRECPKAFDLLTLPCLPCLTPSQQARLGLVLKRALHQCDRIADLAAHCSCPPIPLQCYDYILEGVYESSTDVGEWASNPLTKPHIRPMQIEYIQSLSLEDVTGIYILVDMLGYNLTCPTCSMRYERKTIIEECILRHGTWFIWSLLRGRPGMREMAGYIISAGRTELRQWEDGATQGPASLKMTLLACFRNLVAGNTASETTMNMETACKRLVVGAEEEEEERTGASLTSTTNDRYRA